MRFQSITARALGHPWGAELYLFLKGMSRPVLWDLQEAGSLESSLKRGKAGVGFLGRLSCG